MTDQSIEQIAREMLNARCEYMGGMDSGQVFIKTENALLAVKDALLEGMKLQRERDAVIAEDISSGFGFQRAYDGQTIAAAIRSAMP